jgi:hypothetical protein
MQTRGGDYITPHSPNIEARTEFAGAVADFRGRRAEVDVLAAAPG